MQGEQAHVKSATDRLNWLEIGSCIVSGSAKTPPAEAAGHSFLHQLHWSLSYKLDAPDHWYDHLPSSLSKAFVQQPASQQATIDDRPRRFGIIPARRQKVTPSGDSATVTPASSAHVYLFLPIISGWLITEHVATVKHLGPVEHEEDWRKQLSKDWSELSPVLTTAGQIASDAAGVPEIGMAAKAIAGLKATSVPSTSKTKWYIRTVDILHGKASYRGIEWHLSRELLTEVGGRISGSLLVGFTKSAVNLDGGDNYVVPISTNPPVLAKAALQAQDRTIDSVPEGGSEPAYLELDLELGHLNET